MFEYMFLKTYFKLYSLKIKNGNENDSCFEYKIEKINILEIILRYFYEIVLDFYF